MTPVSSDFSNCCTINSYLSATRSVDTDNQSLKDYFKKPYDFHLLNADQKNDFCKERSDFLRDILAKQQAGNPYDFSGVSLSYLDLREMNFGDALLAAANLSLAKMENMTSNTINKYNNYYLMIDYLAKPDNFHSWLPAAQQKFIDERSLYVAKLYENKDPEIPRTLKGADLSLLNLSNINFGKTNLDQANLRNVNLNGANLSQCTFRLANLEGAYSDTTTPANNVHFRKFYLRKPAEFEKLPAVQQQTFLDERSQFVRELIKQNQSVDLSNCDLSRLDMSGLMVTHVNFEAADLREANVSGSNFSGCNLWSARLTGLLFDREMWDKDTIFPIERSYLPKFTDGTTLLTGFMIPASDLTGN